MGGHNLKNLEKENEPKPKVSPVRKALPQIIAVSVKNVLLFAFGMTLGFPTILIPSFSDSKSGERITLDQDAISWISSVNLLCVPLGCLLSGVITQPLGRRRAMQLVNIPFLAAWLLFHYATEPWHVFLALCITGFSGGLLEAPTLTYLAEVTTPNLRGVLASTSTVAVISGILTQFLLGTFFYWRTVALICSIMPVISCFLLFFVPESPYWLVSKNRLEEAQMSIAWLRGWLDMVEVEEEFKEFHKLLISKSQSETDVKSTNLLSSLKTNIHLYLQKRFLWPFSLVTLSFALGHFGGMTTLQTYSVTIFANLKAPIDKYFATVILGIAQALGCILSSLLVHFLGKRKMNFLSLIGTAVCFFVVATYAQILGITNLRTVGQIDQDNIQIGGFSWIPMTFLIGAAFFSHTGIRILPWMLVGEVYYSEIRATASGFSGAASYILGFCANKLFLSLISLITLPGTFWMHTAVCFLGFLLLYFLLPETEGKTLFQITDHFSGGSKMDNSVTNFVNRKKMKKKAALVNGKVNPVFDDTDCDKNNGFIDIRL
ncbi:facilitated trehalose transporter Tret1 isoform X2 [Anthonomus grandis grandis]|uniref:facilitated trehalose transporter Tret1 isoform X2 n=1 Tax=Anthonomus grandis grandis TaxID=2921223 RepID=UPI00216624BC|nr:facilitated trehalose transporter Tret1 isoform X2 [Anthonomus grandis grandis]